MEQQLRSQQTTDPPSSPNPAPDFTNAMKAAYSCGVLDGMLKAMEAAANAQGAEGMKEALKQTACEEIRQYANAEVTAQVAPVKAQDQKSEVGTPLGNAGVVNMVKVGLKDDTIINIIGIRPPRYWLTEVDRHDLSRAGVSDAVIRAMEDRMAGRVPSAR